MPTLASWAEFGANWAPSVVEAGGHYVVWYAARDHASGRQCVSRAVSDSPDGPFVDELTAAPVCQLALGGSIDPNVFTDTDGTHWLYWKSDENAIGNHAHLWVAQLSGDARTVTGSRTSVLAQDATWEAPTMEQPAVVRNGATYYLFYSAGWWESDGYGVGYATGPSPTGPFTKRTSAAPWLATSAGASGPGALDVFAGPGGLWASFHAWPGVVGYSAGGIRTMRLARLSF
jgi:beta-xylosidase